MAKAGTKLAMNELFDVGMQMRNGFSVYKSIWWQQENLYDNSSYPFHMEEVHNPTLSKEK